LNTAIFFFACIERATALGIFQIQCFAGFIVNAKLPRFEMVGLVI